MVRDASWLSQTTFGGVVVTGGAVCARLYMHLLQIVSKLNNLILHLMSRTELGDEGECYKGVRFIMRTNG